MRAIGSELLVRKGIVEDPHLLTDTDESKGAGREEQLGLQGAVAGNDLELQLFWIGPLAFGGLQGRDAPCGRRANDIGAAAVRFRDPLLDRREFVAQRLDLFRQDDGKLLE